MRQHSEVLTVKKVSAWLVGAILALAVVQAHATLGILGGVASGGVVGSTWFGATLPTAPTTFTTTSSPPAAGSTCNGSYFTPSTGTALQTDLNSAAANTCANGDVIELTAGTTYTTSSSFNLPAHTGGWIYIISSDAPEISGSGLPAAGTRVSPSNLSAMPSLRTSAANGGYVVTRSASAAYYRFVGIDMEVTDSNASGGVNYYVVNFDNSDTSLSTLGEHITFDRCYFDGSQTIGVNHAVNLDGEYMEITESYFGNHVFTAGNADTQAILAINSVGPYRINNNYIQASGEESLFGGSDTSLPSPAIASDISETNNDFYKPIIAATGSVNGTTTLTVTSVSSGYLQITSAVNGTDITACSTACTIINAQLTGVSGDTCPAPDCTGLVGTYQMSQAATGSASGISISSFSTGKNMVEFKEGQRVLFSGNYLTNAGAEGQARSAFVLTSRNQSGGNPWFALTDFTIENNVFTNAQFGGINILMQDNISGAFPTQPAARVLFRNNIFILTANDSSDATAPFVVGSNSPSLDQIVNFTASVAGASSGTLTAPPASLGNGGYCGMLGYSGSGSFPAQYTNYFCPITISGTAASWGGNLPASPAVTEADIGLGGGGGGSSLVLDHNTFIATSGSAEAMVFGVSSNVLSATNCVFSNNIFDSNEFGIGAVNSSGSFVFGYSSTIPANCTDPAFVGNVMIGSTDSTLPSGNYKPSNDSAVGFTSYGSGTSATGYALTSGSPYHAVGVSGSGLPYTSPGTSDGTDIGVNVGSLPTS